MLELRSASRLHFGLIELAANQPNRFGGLGLMIQSPALELQAIPIHPDQTQTQNFLPQQTNELDRRIQATVRHVENLVAREFSTTWIFRLVSKGQLHSGLGFGTQLAASVAALVLLGLEYHCDRSPGDPAGDWELVSRTLTKTNAVSLRGGLDVQEWARWSGRGKRSAIGVHGFLFGGLIQDLGFEMTNPNEVRPINTRSQGFPPEWSIVLITNDPTCDSVVGTSIHGAAEEHLIKEAGAIANPNREQMLWLSDQCMRAAADHDFSKFVTTLDSYMELASRLFESVQCGRYRDTIVASRVEAAIQSGLCAAGQSSWGPTVFGFAKTPELAQQSAHRLRSLLSSQPVQITVTQAAVCGARWK